MTSKELVKLEKIKLKVAEIKIKGLSSYISNKMSEETEKELQDRVQGKSIKEKHKIRDLNLEVEKKIHKTPEGKVGIPAISFKKAIVESAPYIDGLDKKLVKGAIQVLGDTIPIKYAKKLINKTICRSRMGQPLVTWRPEFTDWNCKLVIQFNENQISIEQIIELFKIAGFQNGVGSWTPQHSGNHGLFCVE